MPKSNIINLSGGAFYEDADSKKYNQNSNISDKQVRTQESNLKNISTAINSKKEGATTEYSPAEMADGVNSIITLKEGTANDTDVTEQEVFLGEKVHGKNGKSVEGKFTVQKEIDEQNAKIDALTVKLNEKVSYPKPKQEQEKEVTVTKSGPVVLTPDNGKVLSKATVTVEVEPGVTSFNGRKGSVTPQAGDYTAEQVGARPDTWEPDLSGYVETPASGSVGQALVVKSVDSSGKPTDWECKDAGSGEVPIAYQDRVGGIKSAVRVNGDFSDGVVGIRVSPDTGLAYLQQALGGKGTYGPGVAVRPYDLYVEYEPVYLDYKNHLIIKKPEAPTGGDGLPFVEWNTAPKSAEPTPKASGGGNGGGGGGGGWEPPPKPEVKPDPDEGGGQIVEPEIVFEDIYNWILTGSVGSTKEIPKYVQSEIEKQHTPFALGHKNELNDNPGGGRPTPKPTNEQSILLSSIAKTIIPTPGVYRIVRCSTCIGLFGTAKGVAVVEDPMAGTFNLTLFDATHPAV